MPETWFVRNTAGDACGVGTRLALSLTQGPALQSAALDATGRTWNRVETARIIANGTWQVTFGCTTPTGGGSANTIGVLLERRNSSCVVLETIINQTITTNKGATETLSTTPIIFNEIIFNAGDILTLSFRATAGNQTKTLRWDFNDANNAGTRLINPDTIIYTVETSFIGGLIIPGQGPSSYSF